MKANKRGEILITINMNHLGHGSKRASKQDTDLSILEKAKVALVDESGDFTEKALSDKIQAVHMKILKEIEKVIEEREVEHEDTETELKQ